MKKAGILIVAGGTGGHIFPALAFGEWLKSSGKAEWVTYVSGSRALEGEIYGAQNIVPVRLPISGSPLGGVSLSRAGSRCLDLFRAFFRTRSVFGEERPELCFLFGGYVSLMPLLWSRLLKVPAVMHEQNAHAGRVTRLASRLGVPVAAGWEKCEGLAGPFTTVGVPVRPLVKTGRQEAARILDVRVGDDDTVIGVIGGSLGSASLNTLPRRLTGAGVTGGLADGLSGGLNGKLKRKPPVFVVAGEDREAPGAPSVRFVGRRWDMGPFYSLVDGVIARAGASTLAELAAYGIPALIVPWEGAADGHQEMNARCFARATSNTVWLESEEGNGKGQNVFDVFFEFLDRCERGKTRKEKGISDVEAASSTLWRMGLESMSDRKSTASVI